MAILAAVAFAFPALAAAEAGGSEGSLEGTLAPAPTDTHWTQAELESAEPLPVVELPGVPSGGPRTAAHGNPLVGPAPTFSATEVGEAESTAFPNGANGKLFGEFVIPLGGSQIREVKYECSAAVVPSRRGNVIVTAAHCVIDPGTGTTAAKGSLIFIPGYRNGVGPDGRWEATSYETTKSWAEWAKRKVTPPNEGEDLAFLSLAVNQEEENSHYGENVEKVVGSLGIAFDQACNQTYTQYGYPAESPYTGEALFTNVAVYAGTDPNPAITPKPVKIASDFTRGASGGPWTIGSSSAPTVLSLTAYGYENQPGYLYGPYLGEGARKAYERAAATFIPIGIEETCPEMPLPPTPAPPAPAPPIVLPGPEADVSLRLTRLHHLANGSAVLTAKVSSAGKLKLRGSDVRTETVNAPVAGKYRLVVATKGPTNRKLRRRGRVKVGVKVAFSASGKTRRISRSIHLSRQQVERSISHHTRHPG